MLQDIHIDPGARVMATDGEVGRVRHLVVDEPTHEITDLVLDDSHGQAWLLPASAVASAGPTLVRLAGSQAQVRAQARPFDSSTFDAAASELASEDTLPLGSRSDRLQLREEELLIQRRRVQAGEVHVGTRVVKERQELDVPVTREEVIVEHHPVEPKPADWRAGPTDLQLAVYEEEVVLEASPFVAEEVVIHKQAATTTRRVSGTVRREVARMETTDGLDTDHSAPGQ